MAIDELISSLGTVACPFVCCNHADSCCGETHRSVERSNPSLRVTVACVCLLILHVSMYAWFAALCKSLQSQSAIPAQTASTAVGSNSRSQRKGESAFPAKSYLRFVYWMRDAVLPSPKCVFIVFVLNSKSDCAGFGFEATTDGNNNGEG